MGPLFCFLLAVLALPPVSVPGAGYICLIPLLTGAIRRRSATRNVDAVLVGGAVGAYAYWGAYTQSLWLYTICIVLTATLYGLFGLVARIRFCSDLTGTKTGLMRTVCNAFSLAIIWSAGEQLVNALGLPYTLALTVVDGYHLRQMAAWGGATSVSFLLVFGQCLLLQLCYTVVRQKWHRFFTLLGLVAGIVVLVVSLSTVRQTQLLGSDKANFQVVVAQTSFAGDVVVDSTSGNHPELIARHYRSLINEVAAWYQQTKLPFVLIWPESALPMLSTEVPNDVMQMHVRGTLATVRHVYTLRSINTVSSETRVYDAAGDLVSVSSKLNPVPFAENVLSPGRELVVHDVTEHGFGSLICYEAALSTLPRKLVKAGARWLTVLSNDNFQGASYLSHMTLGLLQLRATETGVTIVRADNGGASAIVKPDGEIASRLGPFSSDILAGEVLLPDNTTFYVLFGYYVEWVYVVFAVILGLTRVILPRPSGQGGGDRAQVQQRSGFGRVRLISPSCIVLAAVVSVYLQSWHRQYLYASSISTPSIHQPLSSFAIRYPVSADTGSDSSNAKRLNTALYYIRRHFGFLRARRPPINSADELANWAAVYGLEPRIGKLDLLSPRVRHAAAGLVEWSNQAYLIVVGRKSGYVRLKNPENGKVLIMPESQFLRFTDNRIVWFLPQSVSEVSPVHNPF